MDLTNNLVEHLSCIWKTQLTHTNKRSFVLQHGLFNEVFVQNVQHVFGYLLNYPNYNVFVPNWCWKRVILSCSQAWAFETRCLFKIPKLSLDSSIIKFYRRGEAALLLQGKWSQKVSDSLFVFKLGLLKQDLCPKFPCSLWIVTKWTTIHWVVLFWSEKGSWKMSFRS